MTYVSGSGFQFYEEGVVRPLGITTGSHLTLRQLIHLADDDGPMTGFSSSPVKEIGPWPFPTASIWWSDNTKTKKIVDCTIVRNSQQLPITQSWKAYDSAGSTIEMINDYISYSGPFETQRVRILDWNPSLLSPSLWLRADLGITLATGVSTWADQSGIGNNFSQADTTKQPVIVNNEVYNKPGIFFDGSNDFMSMTKVSYAPNAGTNSKFFVFKSATIVPAYRSVFDDHATSGNILYCPRSTDTRALLRCDGGVNVSVPGPGTSPALAKVIQNGTGSGQVSFAVNTSSTTTTQAFGTNHATPIIGASIAGSTEPFSGSIAEIVVVSRILSALEYTTLINYFNMRYGASWT